MHTPGADGVFAAIASAFETRFGLDATAVLAIDGDAPRCRFATGALADPAAGAALEAALSPPPTNGQRRLDPRRLGPKLRFATVEVIVAPDAAPNDAAVGLLVVASERPRRVGTRLAAAIGIAARVAAPLLVVPPPARGATAGLRAIGGRAPAHGAIVSRRRAELTIAGFLAARAPGTPVALLAVDLDRFRGFSAAFGASAAEAVLAAISARLADGLGTGDRLIRLEGDRFVIVSGGDAATAQATAQRALAAIDRPLALGARSVMMQASIGVVTDRTGGASAAQLLDRSEAALARAKAEGRNRAAFHEPRLEAALQERSQIELDLPQALARGQMRLAYQPYIDLATGQPSGAEALLRWRHPSRGEVAPMSFIPLAEASGLILPLGFWALRTACAAAARWPAHLTLSVNVSALMFHEPGFVAEVEAALAASRFPPARLELEITETVLMRDNPATIAQLRALIAHGIRIALDDFGTGYSALAYLARLPHHRIKLDRSFVRDLKNPATIELIRAIIALARRNGIAITAEGVERPDELRAARELGFTHAQGFATGAPAADTGLFDRLEALTTG